MFESQMSGDLTETKKPYYLSVEDALLNQNAYLPDEINEHELGDVMHDYVYIALDYSVVLGGDWNTNTYGKAMTPLKIQGWQITVDLTSSITTAYARMFSDGEEVTTITNNIFEDPDLPEEPSLWDQFIDWVAELFGWDRKIAEMIIIIIICVLAFIIIIVTFPQLIPIIGKVIGGIGRGVGGAVRKTGQAIGTASKSVTENIGERMEERQKERGRKKGRN
jgi:hypothetical protein